MSEDVRPYRNRQPRWRRARRQAMKAQGITPAERQWIWNVRIGGLAAIPDWARDAAVRGLGQTETTVWLWPVDGRRLVKQDRAAGGLPEVQVVEVRRCQVCSRPLVGVDADRRRRLDESGPDGRSIPCSDQCRRDRDTKVWKKVAAADRGRRDQEEAA